MEYKEGYKNDAIDVLIEYRSSIKYIFKYINGISGIIVEDYLDNLKQEECARYLSLDNHSNMSKSLYYNHIYSKYKREYLFPFSYPLQKDVFGVKLAQKEDIYGQNISVGIIDSGIDPKHPLLRGKISKQIDFTNEGLQDIYGHGTTVARLITMITPHVKIYNAKIVNRYGFFWESDLIAGIEWMIDNKLDVLNISLGFYKRCDGKCLLCKVTNIASDHGLIVTSAAGNLGMMGRMTIACPASAKKAFTVGSVEDYDFTKRKEYSSFGPTRDGRLKPDLVAPDKIYSVTYEKYKRLLPKIYYLVEQ